MNRIPPSETIRQALQKLLTAGLRTTDTDPLNDLVRLAARLVLQEALEAEQADFLGRDRYERDATKEFRGYRNGYEPATLKTAEGKLEIALPQVRAAAHPFHSSLLGFLGGHTDLLSRLVTEMYARGLSTRDIEDAFTDASGECLLTRSGVSEVTDSLFREYQAFQERDLGKFEIAYLFVDAIYESLRQQADCKEAVLVCWAICQDGRKVLLHLGLGNKESYECWRDFFRSRHKRHLSTPITVTTDGAPGLLRAVSEAFPNSLRLRCWFHKMANVLAKIPDREHDLIRAHLCAIRDAPTLESGQQAAAAFIQAFGPRFPSAIKSFSDDLQASLAHLRLPEPHRKSCRTTNLIERSFVEERRRTKIIPRFLSEKSCLKLVFGTLIRAARRWQRIRITELQQAQMQPLRKELGQSPPPQTGQAEKVA
ncbi:MAG TPA: IS256 family transposase [Chthonomonadaceae bacterium]|nr:IS256 family transposase [Chthonomonadaceae bacterium]